MLLDPNGNKLGDKRVENTDAIARLREKIRKENAHRRLRGQDMFEKQDMALGEPMSPTLFIEKLKRLPNIVVEPGGLSNAVAVRWITTEDGKPAKRYLSGFYTDRVLPEFSSILPNEFGIPTREVRGWRTVLLALFQAGAVDLKTLTAAFGDSNGQRSIVWQEQTKSQRT